MTANAAASEAAYSLLSHPPSLRNSLRFHARDSQAAGKRDQGRELRGCEE